LGVMDLESGIGRTALLELGSNIAKMRTAVSSIMTNWTNTPRDELGANLPFSKGAKRCIERTSALRKGNSAVDDGHLLLVVLNDPELVEVQPAAPNPSSLREILSVERERRQD
ncbi:MAG: hypothetical protein M3217_05480, partial [Actinomycetota bacterium]|nr:hypothetical protein [Actinomycetota bacterium]